MNGLAQIPGGAPAVASGGARCGFPHATGVSEMPDGMMSAVTKGSSQNQTTSPQRAKQDIADDAPQSGLPAVRRLIDDIHVTAAGALTAFDIVFGIMEEASESVTGLDDPEKKWMARFLPGYVDQLYYLLGDIEKRVRLVQGNADDLFNMVRPSGALTTDADPVEALARASVDAEDAYNAYTSSPTGEEREDKRLEEIMAQTAERLIAHRTITPLGILRKLEHAARVESFERDLQERPQLAVARIVMGLIGDLKESLGMQ